MSNQRLGSSCSSEQERTQESCQKPCSKAAMLKSNKNKKGCERLHVSKRNLTITGNVLNFTQEIWKSMEVFMATVRPLLATIIHCILTTSVTLLFVLSSAVCFIFKSAGKAFILSINYLHPIVMSYFSEVKESQQTGAPSSSNSDNSPGILLPSTSREAVKYLLKLRNSDPFRILNVNCNTKPDEIKRKYHRLAILVHPDKCSLKGANEAFLVLKTAFESLNNPNNNGMTKGYPQNTGKDQEQDDEGIQELLCGYCSKYHSMKETKRNKIQARYCSSCREYHEVTEGDVWIEGYLWYAMSCFICHNDKVYDITDLGLCQGLMDSKPNDHNIRVKLVFDRPEAKRRKEASTSWDSWYQRRAKHDGFQDYVPETSNNVRRSRKKRKAKSK